MSDWLSYTLSDFLLFSPRTYYRLFELYNAAIWPMQIVALLLGVAIVFLWWRGGRWHASAIAAILAACWLWVAYVFLLTQYDTINWAAKYFAAGFVLQTLLLAFAGIVRNRLALRSSAGVSGWGGPAVFLFALVVQPLAAPLMGRPWSQIELFGIAPDPTAVATLGVLLAAERAPGWLFVLPAVWCAISGATLWTMQSPDAPVTPAVAVLALVLAFWNRRRASA
jgi:hypothetical protein